MTDKPTEKYCKKCKCDGFDRWKGNIHEQRLADNCSCPCHSPTEKREGCNCSCHLSNYGSSYCMTYGSLVCSQCGNPTNYAKYIMQRHVQMEEEYRDLLPEFASQPADYEAIEDFIRSTRTQAYEEGVEAAAECVEDVIDLADVWTNDWEHRKPYDVKEEIRVQVLEALPYLKKV